MKKVSVAISSIAMCCILFFGINGSIVSAASSQNNDNSNGSYVNDNGIKINKQQYDNLISQGFEDLDIKIMNQEAFDMNKNIHAQQISKTTKYIKTTLVDDDSTSVIIVNKPKKYVNTELTEEQMNREVEEVKKNNSQGNQISPFGTETGQKPTTYKTLTTVISKLGTNKYRANNTLNWNIIPPVRRYDILGASVRYPDYWTADHTNRGGTQYYEADSYSTLTGVIKNAVSETIQYSASSGNWTNSSFSGAALVQNLKDNWNDSTWTYSVSKLRQNSWFNFDLTNTSYPYTTVNIMGAYDHQVDSSLIQIDGFTLTYGAPTIAFKLGNSPSSYEGEITAVAYISK